MLYNRLQLEHQVKIRINDSKYIYTEVMRCETVQATRW
jgi:hypothetical protein